MAVSNKWYSLAVKNRWNGGSSINWTTDTIKVALCTSSYTPDQDAHDFFDDITNELSSGSGYTAGGKAITTPTVTYNSGTNTIVLDCDDIVWTSSTLTARYAVFYKSTGTASTSPLIGYIDFGTNVSSTGGSFSITLDATDGAFKAVVS